MISREVVEVDTWLLVPRRIRERSGSETEEGPFRSHYLYRERGTVLFTVSPHVASHRLRGDLTCLFQRLQGLAQALVLDRQHVAQFGAFEGFPRHQPSENLLLAGCRGRREARPPTSRCVVAAPWSPAPGSRR